MSASNSGKNNEMFASIRLESWQKTTAEKTWMEASLLSSIET
jgi:hypothetical protein